MSRLDFGLTRRCLQSLQLRFSFANGKGRRPAEF